MIRVSSFLCPLAASLFLLSVDFRCGVVAPFFAYIAFKVQGGIQVSVVASRRECSWKFVV